MGLVMEAGDQDGDDGAFEVRPLSHPPRLSFLKNLCRRDKAHRKPPTKIYEDGGRNCETIIQTTRHLKVA
jgi:hypothetical protein